MKKLNNQGITLIELLVSLTILSIFMITVNYFVASSSKTTKQTKNQINLQRDSQDVYDTLYDSIIQATSIDVKVGKVVTEPTATASGDADTKIRKSAGFDSLVASGGDGAYIVSKNAYDSMEYAASNYSSADDYKSAHTNIVIGKAAEYKKDKLGNIIEDATYTSYAQYIGAVGLLNNTIKQYAAFDDGEYSVRGITTGPVEIGSGSTKEVVGTTILYEDDPTADDYGYIYLNRSSEYLDFTKYPENVIAKNCTEFTVNANGGKSNSLYLKLTFSDSGYSYTVGGTVNIRNANVMD